MKRESQAVLINAALGLGIKEEEILAKMGQENNDDALEGIRRTAIQTALKGMKHIDIQAVLVRIATGELTGTDFGGEIDREYALRLLYEVGEAPNMQRALHTIAGGLVPLQGKMTLQDCLRVLIRVMENEEAVQVASATTDSKIAMNIITAIMQVEEEDKYNDEIDDKIAVSLLSTTSDILATNGGELTDVNAAGDNEQKDAS